MIEPNIYCKVCGMTMRCISRLNDEENRLPLVCEIGCADGQGVMRYAGFCSEVICIDPMVESRPDIHSDSDDELPVDSSKLSLFNDRTKEFNVKLIMGLSLSKKTIEEFKKVLGDRKLDILVVDGCHHPYEAVIGDFNAYYQFVKKGGYIIFDDLYEDCILQASATASTEHNLEVCSHWGVKRPDILQECLALRKTED